MEAYVKECKKLYTCKWLSLLEKKVYLPHINNEADFYSLELTDYVAICAQTKEGKIPIIRQYRPAIEAYTWEFPSGIMENDESPKQCCIREISEEAGLIPQEIIYLGDFYPDVGRLSNKVHFFFVKTSGKISSFHPEPGLSVKFMTPNELDLMLADKTINFIIHVALWNIIKVKNLLSS